jgi:hypothetical protein
MARTTYRASSNPHPKPKVESKDARKTAPPTLKTVPLVSAALSNPIHWTDENTLRTHMLDICSMSSEARDFWKSLPPPPKPKPKPIIPPAKLLKQNILSRIDGDSSKSRNVANDQWELQVALKNWSEQWYIDKDIDHPVLALTLVGTYEIESLSLKRLNYHDRHTISKLQEACKHTGFYLCFAHLDRWTVDRDDTSTLDSFVDCNGSKPFEHFSHEYFSEFNILDGDTMLDEDPDEEETENPHFAEDDDYLYRRWERTVSNPRVLEVALANGDRQVVLFMPRCERISLFLAKRTQHTATFIERTIEQFSSSTKGCSTSAVVKDDLIQICKLFAREHTQKAYPLSLTARLKIAAATLEDQSLLAGLNQHRQLHASDDTSLSPGLKRDLASEDDEFDPKRRRSG